MIKNLKRKAVGWLNGFEEDGPTLLWLGKSRENRIYSGSEFLYPFCFKGLMFERFISQIKPCK